MFIFKEKFHGYIFVDAKGNEYPAIVEFAPYQRMGRVRSKKVDRKCNTFETNEHFMEFVRTMDTEEALPKLELKSDFDAKHDNQIRLTPLLEFLNDKKSRKRDRDRKQQQQEKKKILAPIKEDGPAKNSRQPKERQGKQQATPRPAKEESGTSKRERPERSEKEKARRAERDKMRREKRQQENLEKKKERELLKQQKSSNDAVEAGTGIPDKPGKSVSHSSNTGTGDEPRKPSRGDSKKFSERRQDNRSKQSSKRSEDAPASAAGKQAAQSAGKAGTAADAGKPDKPAAGEEKKKESRRYSERRVRNKDRPTIKIYQPGSRTKPAEE